MNKIFYRFLISVFTRQLRKRFQNKVNLIIRNGVAHEYALFPFSDIDITILFNDFSIKDELTNFLKRVSQLCPYFKEFNVYFSDDLSNISALINPCEAIRDISLVALNQLAATKIQKLVFFYRCALANKSKGIINSQRSAKWNFYLGCMDIRAKVFNYDQYCSIVYTQFQDCGTSLVFFREGRLHPGVDLVSWLMSYFNRDADYKEIIDDANLYCINDQYLILEQTNWEVLGVYSQLIFIDEMNGVVEHFENLIKLVLGLDKVQPKDKQKTCKGMSMVIEHIHTHYKS